MTRHKKTDKKAAAKRIKPVRMFEPRFKKMLGQNFLRDDQAALNIAEAIDTEHLVVEIGPGDGYLTNKLLDTGHNVLGVELDAEWLEKLANRLKRHDNFRVITGNILDLDWDEMGIEHEQITIAGNLPYHMTSPIVFAMFKRVRENLRPHVHQMVIMVQKEVGMRLTAQPRCKAYGGLTLLAHYHADVEYLFTVPSTSFMPKPRVDGAVLRFNFRNPENFAPVEYQKFRRIVRGCFAQRRKMMRNSLHVLNDLPEGWENLEFDFTKRPDQLTFDDFVTLTNLIDRLSEGQ